MKTKYLFLLIFVLFFGLNSQGNSILRVKAIGKAPLSITQITKARTMAFRAAKLAGYKKLIIAAGFSNSYKVGKKKFTIADGHLAGVKIVNKTYLTDYEVELVMEVPAHQVVQQLSTAKKKFCQFQISQIKKKIKAIELQIDHLNMNLKSFNQQLRELEELKK